MKGCETAQPAIADALSLEELLEITASEAVRGHLETCSRCGEALVQAKSYFQVIDSARSQWAESVSLPASTWVAIRQGVDESSVTGSSLERFWKGRPFRLGLGVLAVAVATFAITTLVDGEGRHVPSMVAPGLASSGQQSLQAPVVAFAPSVLDADKEEGFAVGKVLRTEGESRTIRAFGRHELKIAAHSEVVVEAWSRKKMTLHIVAGGVRCDVNRAADEDVFEVIANDIKVRVLGTVFSVAHEASGAVSVGVERGKVSVQRGKGAVQYVVAGGELRLPVVVAAAEVGASSVTEVSRPAELPARTKRRTSRRERKGKTIEITVPDKGQKRDARAEDYDATKALLAVMSRIRKGDCRSALKALVTIEAVANVGQRGDAAYLRAWCSHKLGRQGIDALYQRYLSLDSTGRWPLPEPSGKLPIIPKASDLLH